MPTKLYVGNLAYSVNNDDLAQHFAQAGKVETATVVTDKFSGQSRGFGFVEMSDPAEATRAVETLNDTDLKGRRIRVDEARRLLSNTERPIADIALETGFTDQSHLTRVFRRVLGETPGDFRRRFRRG